MKIVSILILCPFLIVFNGCSEHGENEPSSTLETNSTEVEILDNSATMYQQKWRLVWMTGPVGKVGIPSEVKIGDTITVSGVSMKVGYIKVTHILEDIPDYPHLSFKGPKKGDITCVIVESEDDLPNGKDANRIWINAKQCMPMDEI